MNAASKITMAITLGAFAALAAPAARAQAEVSPDHFDSPNMAPFAATRAAGAANTMTDAPSLDYAGKVTLEHAVRVNGKRLAAGNYVVVLHSDGKTVQLRLKRRGQTVAMQTVAYHTVASTERGYLVVERRGNTRRVSVIHAGALQLVFARETAARSGGAATLEVLPLAFRSVES